VLAYLTAYDVHRAKAIGRCAPTTGITPFQALVEQVMTQEPYASAKRVFWIVDNCSSHRGDTAIERLAEAFPTAIMVHTPIHASWINQVEIYYSIVQRKALTPNDFTDLAEVENRLAAFEQRFQRHRDPLRLDIHRRRPRRPTRPHRPTCGSRSTRIVDYPGGRLTTDELAAVTTRRLAPSCAGWPAEPGCRPLTDSAFWVAAERLGAGGGGHGTTTSRAR
jgi:hypothetical protein